MDYTRELQQIRRGMPRFASVIDGFLDETPNPTRDDLIKLAYGAHKNLRQSLLTIIQRGGFEVLDKPLVQSMILEVIKTDPRVHKAAHRAKRDGNVVLLQREIKRVIDQEAGRIRNEVIYLGEDLSRRLIATLQSPQQNVKAGASQARQNSDTAGQEPDFER